MDTLSRSWDLVKQSFAILKADKEMMWLPVLSFIFCVMATVTIGGIGLLLELPPGPYPHDPVQQQAFAWHMAPFMFLYYFATYGVTVYFNVALVSIASNRMDGGHATLNDGLQAAWQRRWSIVQWALLAATLGTLLQLLERRFRTLGRILLRGIGLMFALASFFVVPVLAAEDMGPIQALSKSAQIFRRTWGEQVVGGFSFELLFLLFGLFGALPPAMGYHRFGQNGLFVGLAIAMVYWVVLAIAGSTTRGIFVAALYRYATDGKVPPGFSRDDLADAWQPPAGRLQY
jgi:hypothetical protein